jgi:MEMO1 family protein
MRKPVVAGQFYEENKELLIKQIEECFKKGNGFPKPLKNSDVIGAIMPHAGYFFSGKAAALAVKEIAETNIDTFIILGVNHTGIGGNSTTKDDFQTPLGIAKINEELQKILIENCKLEINKEAHNMEHSIEVIIPLLQYVVKKFTFVPIIVSGNVKDLGNSLKKALEAYEKKFKKKICVIASSDMTHFGISYGYMPFHENIKEKMYKLDNDAIKFILEKNPSGFLNYIGETKATICGRNTISTLLYCLEKEKSIKAELLDYYTSADVMGDYRTAVGYAAIVFKK